MIRARLWPAWAAVLPPVQFGIFFLSPARCSRSPATSAELRAQLALERQCKEKDCSKGQEGQNTAHDETGTIVSNEIQHFASSFVLAITRKCWRSSPFEWWCGCQDIGAAATKIFLVCQERAQYGGCSVQGLLWFQMGRTPRRLQNIADRQQVAQTSRSMKNRVRQAKGPNASPNSFGRTHFRSSCSDPKGGRIWLELAGGVRRRLRLA